MLGTDYTNSFPTTSTLSTGFVPPSDTICLESLRLVGGANNGYSLELGDITPTYISFYIRVDSNDKNSVIVVNGDTDQQIFRILFNGTTGRVNGNDLGENLDSATNINTWYNGPLILNSF